MNASDLDAITGQLSRDTQALQAAFKAWSCGRLNDQQVSHAYVQLGNGCLRAQHQLSQSQVPVHDLVNVPDQLRKILEPALAVDPSPSVFDAYEPAIRHVMGAFFRQLKQKQKLLGPARSLPVYPAPSPRIPAEPVNAQTSHSQTQIPQTQIPQTQIPQTSHSQTQIPPQSSQNPTSSSAPRAARRPPRRKLSDSLPELPPSAQIPQEPFVSRTQRVSRPISANSPEQALVQLQMHGVLERQASKRYSTRNLGKLAADVGAMLPTTDVHRTYARPDFAAPSVVRESPPSTPRQSARRSRVSVRRSDSGSPIHQSTINSTTNQPSTPPTNHQPINHPTNSLNSTTQPSINSTNQANQSTNQTNQTNSTNSTNQTTQPELLTLFLKHNHLIRKTRVPKPPSIAALRLQFVEVCDYRLSGEEAFPEILLQDAATGVPYEVTETTVADVTDGSLLALNVKSEEELSVRQELQTIRETLKTLLASSTAPASSRTRVAPANSPPSASAAFSSKYASPVLTGDGKFILEKPNSANSSRTDALTDAKPRAKPHSSESLIRELEQIRQTSARTIAACQTEIKQVRAELLQLSTASVTVALPTDQIAQVRATMDAEAAALVQQMEDLSDLIDRQRLDVLAGGYRLTPVELEQVQRVLTEFEAKFKQSERFLVTERPVWKRVWQAELNRVIESEDWVKHLSALYRDLRQDLDNGVQMFALVREANQMPRDVARREPVLVGPPSNEPDGGFSAVFSEIAELDLDSATRVEAMQRAERQHRVKQAMKIEDLVAEMRTFKPRLNGGFAEAEKKRLERDLRTRELAEESEREGKRQAELLKQQRKTDRAKRGRKKPRADANKNDDANTNTDEKKDDEKKNDDENKSADEKNADAKNADAKNADEKNADAKNADAKKNTETVKTDVDQPEETMPKETEVAHSPPSSPEPPIVIRTEVPTIDVPETND